MNRLTAVLLGLVLFVLAALAAFYLYLMGGSGSASDSDNASPAASTGVISVRSIYTADGENLRRPTGIGATSEGDFYVTLKDDGRVIGFDRNGDYKVKWGTSGLKQGQFLAPLAVAADGADNRVYVVDRARLRVLCFDTKGAFQWERPVLNPVGITLLDDEMVVTSFGPLVLLSREGEPVGEVGSRGFSPGQFDYPRSLAALGGRDVVIADTNNTRVQRVSLKGEATATVKWTTGAPPRFQDDPKTLFGVPSGVTVDDKGRIFVLDGFRHKIAVLDPKSGEVIHTFTDLEGKGDGLFYLPTGIAYLGTDTFAITDTFNDRVQIVRLLTPEENNVIARNRGWLWLLPLLLLALLPFIFGRKKTFFTAEAMATAAEQDRLRLAAGAFGKLHVLPEVAEQYRDHVEQGVEIGEYLVALETTEKADEPTSDEQRLADAAAVTGARRILLPRHTIVCGDGEQRDRITGFARVKTRDWESVVEEFRLVDE